MDSDGAPKPEVGHMHAAEHGAQRTFPFPLPHLCSFGFVLDCFRKFSTEICKWISELRRIQKAALGSKQ